MNKLKLIGRGVFTKCYLMPDNETVLLKSSCPIKECMALGWFPDSSLFPEVNREDKELYTMKYYPRVSSLKDNLSAYDWQMYKDLRALTIPFVCSSDNFQLWYGAFETLTNDDLRETMQEALTACSNYGKDIAFEISPRNVATFEGSLVLLDCFYSISKLNEVRGIK